LSASSDSSPSPDSFASIFSPERKPLTATGLAKARRCAMPVSTCVSKWSQYYQGLTNTKSCKREMNDEY
jgi:hypothetical protein